MDIYSGYRKRENHPKEGDEVVWPRIMDIMQHHGWDDVKDLLIGIGDRAHEEVLKQEPRRVVEEGTMTPFNRGKLQAVRDFFGTLKSLERGFRKALDERTKKKGVR